jgi:hypothetical protein
MFPTGSFPPPTKMAERKVLPTPGEDCSPRGLVSSITSRQPWFDRNADGGNGTWTARPPASAPLGVPEGVRRHMAAERAAGRAATAREHLRDRLLTEQHTLLPPVRLRLQINASAPRHKARRDETTLFVPA